jgi:hypothetical protein
VGNRHLVEFVLEFTPQLLLRVPPHRLLELSCFERASNPNQLDLYSCRGSHDSGSWRTTDHRGTPEDDALVVVAFNNDRRRQRQALLAVEGPELMDSMGEPQVPVPDGEDR